MEPNNLPELDELDREIINHIQISVPLEPRPFAALAREFEITEQEMIDRVRRMWDLEVVRRLGPIVNYRAWGMSGVLVAAKVKDDRIDDAAARASSAAPLAKDIVDAGAFEYNVALDVIVETMAKGEVEKERLAGLAKSVVEHWKKGAFWRNTQKVLMVGTKDIKKIMNPAAEPIQARLGLHFLQRGIATFGRGLFVLSAAHTTEDIDQTIHAFGESLDAMVAEGTLSKPFRA